MIDENDYPFCYEVTYTDPGRYNVRQRYVYVTAYSYASVESICLNIKINNIEKIKIIGVGVHEQLST